MEKAAANTRYIDLEEKIRRSRYDNIEIRITQPGFTLAAQCVLNQHFRKRKEVAEQFCSERDINKRDLLLKTFEQYNKEISQLLNL